MPTRRRRAPSPSRLAASRKITTAAAATVSSSSNGAAAFSKPCSPFSPISKYRSDLTPHTQRKPVMKHLLEAVLVGGDENLAVEIYFAPKSKGTRFEVVWGRRLQRHWTLTDAIEHRDIIVREAA